MKKKKRPKPIYALLAAAVAAVLVLLLRNPYRQYLENDHAATCANARAYLTREYDALAGPESPEEALALLREKTADVLPAAVSWEEIPAESSAEGELLLHGACLSGGTFYITQEDGSLHVTCDIHP